jgi:hypothetical protein
MLSDGYQNMIAMVADIAERAAVLNPQYRSGGRLENLQDRTHRRTRYAPAPEVAALGHPEPAARLPEDAVHRDDALAAGPGVGAARSGPHLRRQPARRRRAVRGGSRVERAAEDVFDVSARPEATERELDELFHLLDTEDYVAAQAKFSALVGRLGPDDAAMVRARWILDTEGGVKHVAPIAS